MHTCIYTRLPLMCYCNTLCNTTLSVIKQMHSFKGKKKNEMEMLKTMPEPVVDFVFGGSGCFGEAVIDELLLTVALCA